MTHHHNPQFWDQRRTHVPALKENYAMYTILLATFSVATVFVPAFIGIRARTNADWRSL